MRDVTAILQDRQGRFWLASLEGLTLYDEASGSRGVFRGIDTGLPFDGGINVLAEGGGKVWCGLRFGPDLTGDVLACYDGVAWRALRRRDMLSGAPVGRLGEQIYNVFPGRRGNLFALTDAGLLSCEGGPWKLVATPGVIDIGVPTTGFEDSLGRLWLGGVGEISCFDPVKRGWERRHPIPGTRFENDAIGFPPIEHRVVRSICGDKSGHTWFITMHGVLYAMTRENAPWECFDLSDIFWERIDSKHRRYPWLHAMGLLEDAEGQVLIATTEGLAVFNRSAGSWELLDDTNSSLPRGGIRCITEDAQGRIWMGTAQGIVVLAR